MQKAVQDQNNDIQLLASLLSYLPYSRRSFMPHLSACKGDQLTNVVQAVQALGMKCLRLPSTSEAASRSKSELTSMSWLCLVH